MPRRVGYDGSDLFDEGRAGRFNGDAGQNGPGRAFTSPAIAPVVDDWARARFGSTSRRASAAGKTLTRTENHPMGVDLQAVTNIEVGSAETAQAGEC